LVECVVIIRLKGDAAVIAEPAELAAPGGAEDHGFAVQYEIDGHDHRDAIDHVADPTEVAMAAQQREAFLAREFV
jgi:hypothetical protein